MGTLIEGNLHGRSMGAKFCPLVVVGSKGRKLIRKLNSSFENSLDARKRLTYPLV